MTKHNTDLGNLYGAEFIAASQAGIDRATRMYGHPTLHLQDRVKAMNFINQHARVDEGLQISPRELVAIQLATAALGILRAEEGQELAVLATITSEVAALAATYEVAKAAPPPVASAPKPFPPMTTPAPRQIGVSTIEKALTPADSK